MTTTKIVSGLPRTPFEQKSGARSPRPTGFEMEPRKISHLVSFACGCLAEDIRLGYQAGGVRVIPCCQHAALADLAPIRDAALAVLRED